MRTHKTCLEILATAASKRCECRYRRPMGRAPCCNGEHAGLKKGPWTHEEDQQLKSFLLNNPRTSWRQVPQNAGLLRCGKSCRLRWMNYLRPDIRRGNFTEEEENLIIQLHASVGNKWSVIASQLPGRTDNEIKNLWNTKLRKMLVLNGINPINHHPMCNPLLSDHVKNFIKSIESAIIEGLMTQSASPPSVTTTTTTENANIATTLLPPLVSLPHLQLSSPEEVLTQFCQIDSSSNRSTSNNNSWVRGSSRNDEDSYDNSIWNVSHCSSNNLSKYLGDEFENITSPYLVGEMDLVASTAPFRADEDGFQY